MRHGRVLVVALWVLGASRQSFLDDLILPSSSSSSLSLSIDDDDSFETLEIVESLVLPKPPLSPRVSTVDPTKRLLFQIEDEHFEVEFELEPFVTTTVRDDQSYSSHLFLQLSTLLSDLSSMDTDNENRKDINGLYVGTNEIVEMAWSLRDYAKEGTKLMRKIDEHVYRLDEYKTKLDEILRAFEGTIICEEEEFEWKEKIGRRVERVKSTLGTAEFALQTLTSIKRRYGVLLYKVAHSCMSHLISLFTSYESSVSKLSSQVDRHLTILELSPSDSLTSPLEIHSLIAMYSTSHSGYHRVRSVIAGLTSAVEGVSCKGVLGHAMLHDRTSNFKGRLEKLRNEKVRNGESASTASLEAQITSILANGYPPKEESFPSFIESSPKKIIPHIANETDLSVFDVYSLDFDYEKYRLEFLHHSNLDDVNFVGDTDPIFKQYFTKTLSRCTSPALSQVSSPNTSDEEFENLFRDDGDVDSIGKILRDFKRMSAEDFDNEGSSSSEEVVQPVQQITFHLLMGGTWHCASQMPDALLVNPDSCPHTSTRQQLGQTLISPPLNLNTCIFLTDPSAGCTDPSKTGRSYPETVANLKGLRELRALIVDQFLTAIRLKMAKMIVGRFGCAGCGLHMEQIGAIYAEVASMLKGHSLVQIYFSDSELFSAL